METVSGDAAGVTIQGETPAAAPSRRGAWLAAGLLLACSALSVGFAWWYMTVNVPHEHTVEFAEVPSVPGRGGPGRAASVIRNVFRRMAQAGPGIVEEEKDRRWLVKGSAARLRVTRAASAGKFDYDFTYPAEVFPADQLAMLRVRRDLLRDPQAASRAGVTDEQLGRLRKISGSYDMMIDSPRRQEIESLWQAYLAEKSAAKKPAAQQKLIVALDTAGKASLARTKQAVSERAGAVSKVLTPAQIAAMQSAPAATAPTRR